MSWLRDNFDMWTIVFLEYWKRRKSHVKIISAWNTLALIWYVLVCFLSLMWVKSKHPGEAKQNNLPPECGQPGWCTCFWYHIMLLVTMQLSTTVTTWGHSCQQWELYTKSPIRIANPGNTCTERTKLSSIGNIIVWFALSEAVAREI
jgi:hypothetical protein